MENASKALIIAGAILLSILIIGLGMSVYNSASSAGAQANLDAQEIQAHNSQFLSYEGKQKGAQVNALINSIKTNNRNYEDRQIMYNISNTTTPINQPKKASASSKSTDVKTHNDTMSANNKIKTTTTYYVTFDYSDNGCICGAEIHVYSNNCGTTQETITFKN